MIQDHQIKINLETDKIYIIEIFYDIYIKINNNYT